MPPMLVRWTIGHNIRTIELYRPKGPRTRSCRGGPTSRAATISPTADGRTATLLETPVHSPGPVFVRHANRNNQCEIFSSQPPPYSWPERHWSAPPIPPNCPREQPTTSCSCDRRFRGPDELAARCRYSHEEGLQRHARRKSAHLARRGRRCHQTGAREAGRQDRSRRPLMGRRGDHASRQRSQGLGAGLRLRLRARGRTIPGVPGQEPARRPKAARRSIPTPRAISTSIPRCFRRPSRLTFLRRSPSTWPTRSFR